MAKLYSSVELAEWVDRSNNGPFRVAGDVYTRSSGDWARITTNRNTFVSEAQDGSWPHRWTAPGTGAVVKTGTATTGDHPSKPRIAELQDAAFYGLIKNDTTAKNLVKQELLWISRQARNNFANESVWPKGTFGEVHPIFELAITMTQMLYSYDYVEDVFTTSEKTEMQNWFKGFADLVAFEVNKDLSTRWVNRSLDIPIEQLQHKAGEVATKIHNGGTNGTKTITAWTGISTMIFYNNRRGHMMAYSALFGCKFESQYHLDEAKKFVRELLVVFVTPDGEFSELERSQTSLPSRGLNYVQNTLTSCLQIADACARRGDFSVYNYKTKHGLGRTLSTTVDKSLLFCLKEYGKYLNGVKKIYAKEGAVGNATYLLDCTHTNWNGINHMAQFSLASMYYKDEDVKKLYLNDTTAGYIGVPTTGIATNGELRWYNGLCGLGAGSFKYALMESVDPYAAQPVIPSAPATITVSAITTSGFTVNWSSVTGATSYKLDISTSSSFSTFVSGYNDLTVSGVSRVVTGLLDDTTYYIRMRAVNTSGTSSNSATITTKTTDEVVVDPDPIVPNLVLKQEVEGNYSKVVDTDNDIGENVELNRSGGKDIKIWDVGDKISIPFNVPIDEYTIKFKARCGDVTSNTRFANSYLVEVNGFVVKATLDISSIGPLEAAYGQSYWGTYVLDKVITKQGVNIMTIEARSQWLGVDVVEFFKSGAPVSPKYSIDQLIALANINSSVTITTPEQLFSAIRLNTAQSIISSALLNTMTPYEITVEGCIVRRNGGSNGGGTGGGGVDPVSTDNTFTFKLLVDSTVSAGVFKREGDDYILVRTLWSAKDFKAGTYTSSWDGYLTSPDELKTLATSGEYVVKILSHNMQYVWNGAHIGNDSEDKTGDNKLRQYSRIHSIVIPNGYMYYATRYSEGRPNYGKILQTNIRRREKFLESSSLSTDQETFVLATDGTRVYYAGRDPFNNDGSGDGTRWFIFATNVSNDTEYSFSSGTSYDCKYGRVYSSVICYLDAANGIFTGLSVQTGAGTLGVATRRDRNEVIVFNKTTGAILNTTTSITAPKAVAFDSDNNLWMVSGTSVNKYTVNSGTGALTVSGTAITGFSDPLAIDVDNTNGLVAVVDGIPSNQVKAYNTTTRTLTWTLGQLGGYATTNLVANDKFWFKDMKDFTNTYIRFKSDGSFWLGDQGNLRNLHFNSSRVLIEQFSYQEHFYSSAKDPNDPKRIFANYLEFERDYNVTLTGTTGYVLKRNWVGGMVHDGDYTRLAGATTFSNGRTYCLHKNGSEWVMLELVPEGTLRVLGSNWEFAQYSQLYPDGSVRRCTRRTVGQPITWYVRSVTGYDGANPIYGPETKMEESPIILSTDPGFEGADTKLAAGPRTADGVTIAWQGARFAVGIRGYHLGGVKNGKWMWRTALNTNRSYYTGDFPKDEYFESGNSATNLGSTVLAVDNHIFAGHHGEFWKNTQTNKYYHFYSNGLLFKVFGYDGTDSTEEAPYGLAGNAFAPSIAKVGNNMYLHSNDEGRHSAVHEWKLSGFDSIVEQSVTIKLDTANIKVTPATGIDLLAPFSHGNISVVNGLGGIVRNPATDITTNVNSDYFTIKSGQKSYDKFKSPDLFTEFRANFAVERSWILPITYTETSLPTWRLETGISFEGSAGNRDLGGQYFEILDANQKVISRFYHRQISGSNPVLIYGNTGLIATGTGGDFEPIVSQFRNLTISSVSGGIQFKYHDFDAITSALMDGTANKALPKFIRMFFWYAGHNDARKVAIKDTWFYKS